MATKEEKARRAEIQGLVEAIEDSLKRRFGKEWDRLTSKEVQRAMVESEVLRLWTLWLRTHIRLKRAPVLLDTELMLEVLKAAVDNFCSEGEEPL